MPVPIIFVEDWAPLVRAFLPFTSHGWYWDWRVTACLLTYLFVSLVISLLVIHFEASVLGAHIFNAVANHFWKRKEPIFNQCDSYRYLCRVNYNNLCITVVFSKIKNYQLPIFSTFQLLDKNADLNSRVG